MQVVVHLDVDAQSLFDCLVRSVAHDAEEAKGKKVAPSKVKLGFSYTKEMKTKVKQKIKVKVRVSAYEAPRIYACEFITPRETTEMRYEIQDDPTGGITVVYSENATTDSKFGNWNYKILTWLYQGRVKRHATNLLKQMEQYILNEREAATETDAQDIDSTSQE